MVPDHLARALTSCSRMRVRVSLRWRVSLRYLIHCDALVKSSISQQLMWIRTEETAVWMSGCSWLANKELCCEMVKELGCLSIKRLFLKSVYWLVCLNVHEIVW